MNHRRYGKKTRGGSTALVTIIMLAFVLGWIGSEATQTTTTINTCTDGIDNDGDGDIDSNDPECFDSPNNPYYDGDEDDPAVNGGGPPA